MIVAMDPDILALSKLVLIAIGIVSVGCTIVLTVAIWRAGPNIANSIFLFSQRGDALKTLTVLLIIVATTLLALLHIIEGTATVAMLSSIAGYVLGTLSGGKTKRNTTAGNTSDTAI